METEAARQTLHELVDQTKDVELLTLCVQLLEREARRSKEQDFFNTTASDLKARTEASMTSIAQGRTRSLQEFKEEIDQWKQNKSM